ncbi:MAG: General stress protein A [bacterium ADurb.BinA186]|jgi:UDP-glucose:(galactosyl)LPS alpha-1,2-glucosyltransferase|nr:MAG: General stress protein A [bacterium ADurb.BinA186]
MNLLFAINEAFVPGLITALTSFCFHNPGHHVAYIMHDGLSAKAFSSIAKDTKHFDVELVYKNIGQGAFTSSFYTSLPRYYSQSINRLLPQLIVPDSVHRLLYLDADLIVRGSLSSFYSAELASSFLAAPSVRRDGEDGGPYWDQEAGAYQMIQIPLKPETLYFNSGVLLLNVDAFRTISIRTYDEIVKKYQKQIVFADQDILNLAFEGKTLNVVDRRLNCTIPDNMRLRKGEYRWIRDNVLVLHFVIGRKPWMPKRYQNRLFHLYMNAYKRTGHPFRYIGRYCVWYLMKPWHFIAHCWRKGISLVFRKEP